MVKNTDNIISFIPDERKPEKNLGPTSNPIVKQNKLKKTVFMVTGISTETIWLNNIPTIKVPTVAPREKDLIFRFPTKTPNPRHKNYKRAT